MLSSHLKSISYVCKVETNQWYHILTFYQYSMGNVLGFSFFFLSKYSNDKINVGGFPSLMSLAINLGQLHKCYRYLPRFCYLGIQPLLSMVSSQLLMTLSTSYSFYLTITSQWKPSSHKKPQGKRVLEGEKDKSYFGSFRRISDPLRSSKVPYS